MMALRKISCFSSSADELAALKSQAVTSNAEPACGGRCTARYPFTEPSMAMLPSVLGSPRAIGVRIVFVRTFVRVRGLALVHIERGKGCCTSAAAMQQSVRINPWSATHLAPHAPQGRRHTVVW